MTAMPPQLNSANESPVEPSRSEYIAGDEGLRKDVLDAKVVRGVLEGSDHYAVWLNLR